MDWLLLKARDLCRTSTRASSVHPLAEEGAAHVDMRAVFERAQRKMAAIDAELGRIVGLHELKSDLRILAKGILLDEIRKKLGARLWPTRLPHMAFLGNPGTGKTMLARVLGKLLHTVGVLPTDKVVEVQCRDLVDKFTGHTSLRTWNKIQEAEGGIVFVDEAYRLMPFQKFDDRDSRDYGLEALREMMSMMDNGSIVVILAGYAEPMSCMISCNKGLSRRVTKVYHFENFNTEELAKITHVKMNHQDTESMMRGFQLHKTCTVEAISELLDSETTEQQRQVLNGGLVCPMLMNARDNLHTRLDLDCCNPEEMITITLEDIKAGIRSLCKETCSEWPKCMRLLVEACLQGVVMPSFLTKRWFEHDDVVFLRRTFSQWVSRVAGFG